MSLKRVAVVRAAVGDGRAVQGSGYLVAPGLVLTAAHVVTPRPPSGQVLVELPRALPGAVLPAEVVWSRYDDDVDAALLRLDGGPAEVPPLRWGELVTELPGREVEAAGFPRMQRTPTGIRGLEQLTGHVHPGTGAPGRRYEILSGTAPVRSGERDGTTPWSGMSGAAVFHHHLLIGVVRHDRRPDGGSRLTATRAVDLLDDPGFRAAVHTATGVRPLPEPAELAPLLTPLAPEGYQGSPTMLLRADAEVVPFQGREREQRELLDWCERDEPTVTAVILAGTGGQGKSRLARWLVTEMTERGWVAGQLDRSDGGSAPAAADLSVFTEVERELLLVVDYADRRPQELREFLRLMNRRSRHWPKVRLLLVARAPGAWNKDPMRADAQVRSILSEAPVIELSAIAHPAAAREEFFRTATRSFSERLDRMPGVRPPVDARGATTRWAEVARSLPVPGTLDEERYGNPLDLQMAALAALLDHGRGHASAAPNEPSEATLLNHEEDYWESAAPTYRVDMSSELLRRVVAAATLCGAANKKEALRTVTRVPELPATQHSEVALLLRKLYPPPPERFWGRLQPDRVAEFLAWQAVAKHENFLAAMLADASPAQQEQLLTDLVQAALAHERAGRIKEGARLLREIETAAEDVGGLHTEALRGCYSALPDWESPPLVRFGLWVTERLVTAFTERGTPADPAERLRDAADLAWAWHQRWAWSSRAYRGGNVEWITKAVELRRALVAEDARAHLLSLATSLKALGYHYTRLGDHEAALRATWECCTILEGLMREDPRTHEAHFANALHNLSIDFRNLGHRRAADLALEQSLKIQTRLMGPTPDRYRQQFARSLAVLARAHGQQGRRRLAIAAAQGAVLHYRQAAAQDPVWGRPLLAWALGVLAEYRVQLPDPGDQSDALTQAEEAAALQRVRAEHYPEDFGTEYAWSMNDLVDHCLSAGQAQRALPHAKEAVRVWASLAEADLDTAGGELAESLRTLADVHRRVGDRARALVAVRRAVALCRRLPDASSAYRREALARYLWTWASICLDTADPRNAAHLVAGVRPALESLAVMRGLHDGRLRYPDGSPFGAVGTLHALERRLGRVTTPS
ncbi:trypsin-like peptidase domain-containing protein [Streptomyces flavalbus]|uniref:Trypsin-like peptidase domain-containing protein n=1 Tax=Streptomyces flavalbus TaxID=2665155 RepID=A0ABW2W5J6_9ACTN